MCFSLEPSKGSAELKGEIADLPSRCNIRSSSLRGCLAPGAGFRPLSFLFFGFLFTSFFLILDPAIAAQAPNLIPAQIDFSRVQALPNHHPRWANAANDAGPMPADQPVEGLTLVLVRPSLQEIAFEQFLADQQNPASPDYHHWLTAAEIGNRFGPSDADVAAIKGWLQSEGLHVDWVAPSKIFIGFGGTAADVSRAFQTELHNYRVDGRSLVSVSSDPMVPQAVAPAIKAIRGLYTIEEEPQHAAKTMQLDSPAINASSTVHFIGPGDFANIYDMPFSYRGTGETIGIVGRSRTDAADFTNFKTVAGGAFANPTEVVPTAFGGIDPGPAYTSPPGTGVSIGNQGEATLDVERAGSVAPGAQLLLVVATQASGGIQVDAQYLVQTVPTPAQVMTISFGACESAAGPAGVNFWDSLFQQAAAEGISSFVASGDSGASGCDAAFAAPPASPQPNSPNYICSSSYATCVGGTEFNDASNPSKYWGSSSGTLATTAYGYIPEGGWNESWNGTTSTVAGSGGGVSSVIATPAWQQSIAGVPAANAGRYTPDVAFSASGHDGYFGCFAAGGGNCIVSNGSIYFTGFAGTSAAAPSMAGIAAMLDQSMSVAQDNLNPGIYQMSMGAPSAFHDVTPASSGVGTCDINTPSICNNSIPGPSSLSGGQAGYLVGTGFDEVTGLGSLDVATFINAYPTARKIQTPTMTVQSHVWPVNQDIPTGVGVSGGPYSPAPTGSIVLTAGSYTSPATPLTNGYVYVYIPTGKLAMGTYTVTANYTPDATSSPIYQAASSTGQLTVSDPQYLTPVIVLSPSASTITSTEAITLSVSVRPGLGNPIPTGTVTATSGSYSSGPVVLVPGIAAGIIPDGEATFSIPAGVFPVGQDMLTVTYVPDTSGASLYLTASNFDLITNEGDKIAPTVQLGLSYPDISTAQALTVTVIVDGFTGNPPPTGTVVVSGGNYTSPPTSLSGGSATLNIAPSALAIGSYQLTATYTPDAQSSALYTGGSGSNWVTVSLGPRIVPTVSLTLLTSNPTTAAPSLVMVTVTGGAGYPVPTGSVAVGTDYSVPVQSALAGGIATVSLPAGTLLAGMNTIRANYHTDTPAGFYYNNSTGTATVNVVKATPAVTISALSSSFTTQDALQVTATVGGGSSAPTATGTITLTGGFFTSNAVAVGSAGTVSVTIPPGSFPAGTDTIRASYSGDNTYAGASGSGTVTVTAPTGATFAIAGNSLVVTKGSGTSNATAVTVTPTNGFVGTVALSATVTASPAGAQDLPTLSFMQTSLNLVDFNAANSTLTVTTTAASSAKIVDPPGSWMRWSTASVPVLACIALWLVPLRRRSWRNLIIVAALAILIAGGVAACGGSGGGTGGGGGGGGGGNSGTTSGQYTITVTGTSGATIVTNTITLTVQ
jgi:hypothetical protein